MLLTNESIQTSWPNLVCQRNISRRFFQTHEFIIPPGILKDMSIDKAAKLLWDYQVLDHEPVRSDCIMALGSSDIRAATRAAELYNKGYGKWLITTGGVGRLSKDTFSKPEAEVFADEAIRLGVPADKIIQEKESPNSFDNLRFTRKHLEERDIEANSFLVVTKPYFERRAYARFTHSWPDKEVTMTSPHLDYETYPNENISKDLLINMLVGDLQRMIVYGGRGDITPQAVPAEVSEACDFLISKGFDEQIVDKSALPPVIK